MKSQITSTLFISILGLGCYLADFTIGIIVCELLLSLYIVFSDFTKGIRNATFLTYFSLFSILYIVGNFMIVYTLDSPSEKEYDYYVSKIHLLDASMISFVGHACLILGYLSYTTRITNFTLNGILPDSFLKPVIIISIIYNCQYFLTGIDVPIIDIISYPFLFLYIKSAVRKNKPEWINAAILLVCLMAIKGLLYSYRRQSALEPFFIFFMAFIISYGKHWGKIFAPKYVLLFVCFVFLLSQFSTMGKIRASGGQERIDRWVEIYFHDNQDQYVTPTNNSEKIEKSSLARASTLNQLSQVVRLQNENGSYNGSTMNYLAFAFIPRFIWPEKPTIMQGRWFALEAGLAHNHGLENTLTEVNNSINMTVAGELFLNFGFMGVILGMIIIGYFLNQCWMISNFYDVRNNLTGTMFGVFLIAVAYFYLQVDMQFLVTLLQIFLTVLAINFLINYFIKNKHSHIHAT